MKKGLSNYCGKFNIKVNDSNPNSFENAKILIVRIA